MYIGHLSEKFESNGDPGAIGFDPLGGNSYGISQIETKNGTFGFFMEFLKKSYPNYYKTLQDAGGFIAATKGTDEFKNTWKKLAKDNPEEFKLVQHEFIVETMYKVAINRLKTVQIDLSSPPHSNALADVIYSLSVMAGPGVAKANGSGSCGLIVDALHSLDLNKLDEKTIIDKIYEQKLKRIDTGREYSKQPVNIRKSVRNRIVHEHLDALQMLTE